MGARQEPKQRMLQLGDRVKDKLSSFTGVVVQDRRRLYGPRTLIVQPGGTDKAKVPEAKEFEPDRLALLGKAVDLVGGFDGEV